MWELQLGIFPTGTSSTFNRNTFNISPCQAPVNICYIPLQSWTSFNT